MSLHLLLCGNAYNAAGEDALHCFDEALDIILLYLLPLTYFSPYGKKNSSCVLYPQNS